MKLGELFRAAVNAGLPMDAEVVVAAEGAVEGDATAPVAGVEVKTLLGTGLISSVTGTAPTVRALVLRTRP